MPVFHLIKKAADFPKREPQKINSENVAHFSKPKNWPPNHHVSPPNHHVSTTKNHYKPTRFSQKPLQNTTTPTQKKIYLLPAQLDSTCRTECDMPHGQDCKRKGATAG
jgi:hypothetical protein